MHGYRVVAGVEKGLVVFVKELLLIVGDVWSLTVPGHEHLRQDRDINGLASVPVGWPVLSALGYEIAFGIARLVSSLKPTKTLSLLLRSRGFTALWLLVSMLMRSARGRSGIS